MGKYEETLSNLNRAIIPDEKDAETISKRGETNGLKEQHEKALVDLNQAIALDGNNAETIGTRGDTYKLMGKYEEALIQGFCVYPLC